MSAITEQDTEDRLGMTEEQWLRFKSWTTGHGEQDENGVDLTLLRANLKLSPTERIEKMRRSLAAVMEVRRAGVAAGLSSHSFPHSTAFYSETRRSTLLCHYEILPKNVGWYAARGSHHYTAPLG